MCRPLRPWISGSNGRVRVRKMRRRHEERKRKDRVTRLFVCGTIVSITVPQFSSGAPTNNSKRWRPSAGERFIPRPRNGTEMRPSMPARKRCPFLKAGLFSYALRFAVFFPPRCGMYTTLTPFRLHDFTFISLKKPRSELFNSGARPKFSLPGILQPQERKCSLVSEETVAKRLWKAQVPRRPPVAASYRRSCGSPQAHARRPSGSTLLLRGARTGISRCHLNSAVELGCLVPILCCCLYLVAIRNGSYTLRSPTTYEAVLPTPEPPTTDSLFLDTLPSSCSGRLEFLSAQMTVGPKGPECACVDVLHGSLKMRYFLRADLIPLSTLGFHYASLRSITDSDLSIISVA